MKKWLRLSAFAGAIAFLILTVVNAQWLAPSPRGGVKLIAHRGIAQQFDHAGVERDTCTAARIEQPVHTYLENTVRGTKLAGELGAGFIEIDIAPTRDGELVAFHDWTLDCRTNGTGPVREATLAELQALDIGYGYTADGGKTFPLRGGSGVDAMPSLKQIVDALPNRSAAMFNFKSDNPAEADLLVAKLKAAGRDPAESRDAFTGHPAPIARLRELSPESWAWSPQEAETCARDYVLYGWTGYLPGSCRGRTMVIPLDGQWAFWGWPNRLIARMEAHGGHIIVTGPDESGVPNMGIDLPEQLGEIPNSFNGYVWTEDVFTIAPSLWPRLDRRRQAEIDAAQVGLERRRARK